MDRLFLLVLAPKVPHHRKPLSPGQTGTVDHSTMRPTMIRFPIASLTSMPTSLASSTPDILAPLLVLQQTGHTPVSGPLHLPLPLHVINIWLTSLRSVLKCHLVRVALCDHQGSSPLMVSLPPSYSCPLFSPHSRVTFQ